MGIEITSGDKGEQKRFIKLIDTRDNSLFEIETGRNQDLYEADEDSFIFPVDVIKETQTRTITIQKRNIIIWDRDQKSVVETVTGDDEVKRGPGKYNVELTATPMKIYFSLEGSISIKNDKHDRTVKFDGSTAPLIGARSYHRAPKSIIQTSGSPEDLAIAVSHLGSSIQKTSPDRTYPTFRDHPPLFEFADSLFVPDDLKEPSTGIQLVVPPEAESIMSVTPLAYYLGATIVPQADTGSPPTLVFQSGNTQKINSKHGVSQAVNRTLETVFYLDCVSRSRMYYDWGFDGETTVQKRTGLNFDNLANQPISERIETYLRVDYETIEDLIPKWPLFVDVEPTEPNIELLPFLAKDLAHVNVVPDIEQYNEQVQKKRVNQDIQSNLGLFNSDFVTPGTSGSMQHACAIGSYPLYANRLTTRQCKKTAIRSEPQGTDTKYIVVENNDGSANIEESYDPKYWYHMTFKFYNDITKSEMRDLLTEPSGMFQYLGKVTEDGIRCSDGYLDPKTVFDMKATTFLIHDCQSPEQATTFVNKGCHAGIATFGTESTSKVAEFGAGLGKFLTTGFPLRTAARLVASITDFEAAYTVLGDGGIPIRHSNSSGCPTMYEVRSTHNQYQVWVKSYTNRAFGIGSTFIDKFGIVDKPRLNPTRIGPINFTYENLIEELRPEEVPVNLDGEIYLSQELVFEFFEGFDSSVLWRDLLNKS